MNHLPPQPRRARARFRATALPLLALALAGAFPTVAMALTFAPTKDAMVKIAFPDQNFGTNTQLQASAKTSFQKHMFLQFTVSGIPTGATNIVAKLHINSQTTASSDPIVAHSVASTSWSETAITWNNQPALGSSLATVSSFTSGSDGVWDVSSYVNANGTFALGLDGGLTTGDTTFSSREGANPPSLVVTYSTASGISVINGNLALDGTLWVPNGLQILAWVAPDGVIAGKDLTAQQHWGQAELDAGRNNWHADLVRMQISICGLDPQNSVYGGTTYINELVAAVTLARNTGFKVLLSMQHEPPSGCQTSTNLPEADVKRAWQTIIPHFKTDPYVMFEDYNEPIVPGNTSSPTAAMWDTYRNGDASHSPAIIGHQDILNTIRAAETSAGAIHHVVLFEALIQGHTFVNAPQPLISDPGVTGKIAYAVHPYFSPLAQTNTERQTYFGNFHDAGNAVLCSEWGAASQTFDCDLNDPTWTPTFITWMRGKNIGVNVMAFDILYDMCIDWSWNPNFYDGNYSCSNSGTEGPGTDIKNDWNAHHGR